jgi:ribosome biogenesis GTPase
MFSWARRRGEYSMKNEHDLTRYGANEWFYNAALPYPDLRMARVIAQYKDLYKIAAERREIFAEIAGKFRHDVKNIFEYPVTGDFVMISPANPHDGNAVIQTVLPRKTVFKRLAVGNTNQEQIIAANIDVIFICVSLNNNFSLNRIERYLSAAWNSGARPVVILTKSDLCNDLENKINEAASAALGADVIAATSTDAGASEKIMP